MTAGLRSALQEGVAALVLLCYMAEHKCMG